MKLVKSNKIIADKVIFCGNNLKRAIGLMFFRKLRDNEALVLKNKYESTSLSSIHTIFVLYPIDVVWLDNNFKVVDLRLNIKPFTPLIKPKNPAKYVIELKNGKGINIKIGDLIRLI